MGIPRGRSNEEEEGQEEVSRRLGRCVAPRGLFSRHKRGLSNSRIAEPNWCCNIRTSSTSICPPFCFLQSPIFFGAADPRKVATHGEDLSRTKERSKLAGAEKQRYEGGVLVASRGYLLLFNLFAIRGNPAAHAI
jgi:hypothetical protein